MELYIDKRDSVTYKTTFVLNDLKNNNYHLNVVLYIPAGYILTTINKLDLIRNDIERRHKYVSLVQIYLTFVHVLKLPNKSV